ncbi:hypothetical protein Tco_0086316 [Tanacetum coccineum]
MASEDARLAKFKADFKQQQSEMTNKIDPVLKAITDRIVGALPSNTVKNLKLSTYLVFSAYSCPTKDPQCSTYVHGLINVITICPKQPNGPPNHEPEEEEEKDNPENIHVNPPTLPDPSVSSIRSRRTRSRVERPICLRASKSQVYGYLMRFLALGWILEEIHVTWAHLEKKQTRLRLYTKSLKKLCIQSVETALRVSSDDVRTFEVTTSEIW